MKLYLSFCVLCQFYLSTYTKIKPKLKKNILDFGCGINYRYEHMVVHSFDRFSVVTKFILPSIGDLKFSNLNYDNTCAYLDSKNVQNTEKRKHMLDLRTFCKKIKPFIVYCKRLIKSYNNTAHNILANEINLLLPQIPRIQKRGIITMLVSSFIGLAYEGIFSFLHHRHNKALHKAVNAMDRKVDTQCNKPMQLENSMLMCSVYNVETLEKQITTVHNIT